MKRLDQAHSLADMEDIKIKFFNRKGSQVKTFFFLPSILFLSFLFTGCASSQPMNPPVFSGHYTPSDSQYKNYYHDSGKVKWGKAGPFDWVHASETRTWGSYYKRSPIIQRNIQTRSIHASGEVSREGVSIRTFP